MPLRKNVPFWLKTEGTQIHQTFNNTFGEYFLLLVNQKSISNTQNKKKKMKGLWFSQKKSKLKAALEFFTILSANPWKARTQNKLIAGNKHSLQNLKVEWLP